MAPFLVSTSDELCVKENSKKNKSLFFFFLGGGVFIVESVIELVTARPTIEVLQPLFVFRFTSSLGA